MGLYMLLKTDFLALYCLHKIYFTMFRFYVNLQT